MDKNGIFIIVVSFIINFFLCGMGYSFQNKIIENGDYKIILSKVENVECDCKFNKRFVFQVYNKQTLEKTNTLMWNMTTSIQTLEIVKNRMVVIGDVGSNIADSATIIDLKKMKEIDFILCYDPVLSKENNCLIYEKFYPRFTPPEALSCLILLYDLSKSPADNRIGERKPLKDDARFGDPGYLQNCENVGIPIYPPKNVEAQSYSVWVKDLEDRHRLRTSMYFWGKGKIVFAEYYKKENWIVAIESINKKKAPIVKKRRIDIKPILNIDRKSISAKTMEKQKEIFRITKLEKGGNGKITISVPKKIKYKTTSFEIDFPLE